jgi:MATE family multidrug resistance protein
LRARAPIGRVVQPRIHAPVSSSAPVRTIPATRAPTWRDETRPVLQLAVPVATVQVGLMLMGVVDTMMVGHLSAAALAAVALGNLYFFGCTAFGMGTLMALDPVVAQAVGAHDDVAVTRAVQRGLALAAALSVLVSLAMLPAARVLAALGQPAELIDDAAAYTLASIPGVPFFLMFVVLRQTMQAVGRIAPIVATIVIANVANVVLNWALIYGHLGAPAMGTVGSAWASSASRLLMAAGLLAAGWPVLGPHLRRWRHDTLTLGPLARMLHLGVPIGVQHLLEYGAFGAIALLMGQLGTAQVAAHQVAINLASLTFMVPLGIGSAAAVLVGRAVGRGDPALARRSALAATVYGVVFMMATAAVLLGVPGLLARAYTRDAAVIAIASTLIPIAGVFQVFDGLQVVSLGVLRGVGDTRLPMLINIVGFWLLGIPLSAYLGFRTAAGPRGLWLGLVLGLAVVSLVLAARVRAQMTGRLARLAIDHR